jgi:hypothetical protein
VPTKDFTKITQKNKKYYGVGVKAKNGLAQDAITRKLLEKAAKKFGGFLTGSGYCFVDGERDFSFAFPSISKTRQFAKEAVEAKLITPKIGIYEAFLEWDYGELRDVNYKSIK